MKKLAKKMLLSILVVFFIVLGANQYFAYEEGEPVRVGIYEMEGFHEFNEDGDPVGYCIDYLNVIAGITGWEYEFVEVKDFIEGLEMIENHEIDLIAPAMMTDARKEKYAYSELEFGTEYSVLVAQPRRSDLYYQDYANYNGLKFGVLNGYPMTDYFIDKLYTYNVQAELIYYDTLDEAEAALRDGSIDALATSILYYDKQYKLLDRFNPQPFYFMTSKENTKLLTELNYAMNRVGETYPMLLEELLHDYYPVYEKKFLNKDEIVYIKNSRTLKVAYVADRKPLSFTNEKGEFDGISRAIFDQISKISGLEFEYVEIPKGEITYDILQDLQVDLVTGVDYNRANMASRGVFLSRPYISNNKVFVSRSSFVYSKDKHYKIAVVEGSKTFQQVLEENYPNMEIVRYESVLDCFLGLYNEEVDMLIQNQHVVEAMLARPVFSQFSVVSVDGIADDLCFSAIVSLNGGYGLDEKESTLIIGIINKAISQIGDMEMEDLVMRESIKHKYQVGIMDFIYSYRYTIAAATGAIIIAFVLLMINRAEKKRYQRIQQEEARHREVQQKRYRTILDCSDDLIYEISLDGETSIGTDKIKEKFGWEIPRTEQTLDFKRAMELLHVYPEDEHIFCQTQLAKGIGTFDDLTLRLCKADGTPIWCRVSRTVLVDKENNPVSILGKIVDIDDEVKEKERLERKSRTDLLTGLLNKQAFEKEVRDYVEAHPTESACFIFIDMDHFKDINDKFGHSVGDQVIRETARKIQLLFANFDLVGRFGGDEFCVFVKDIPRDTLIDRLKFAVKKMEQEYTYEGGVVKLSASIGAAYCKRNSVGYKELMDVADAAAYQAKDNGRNCYIIHDVE